MIPIFSTTYINDNPSPEVKDCYGGHIDTGSVWDGPSDGSSRLWNDHHGVYQSVCDTGQGNGTEDVAGDEGNRTGQHVEESDNEERQNVLQIVEMRPTDEKESLLSFSLTFDITYAVYNLDMFNFNIRCWVLLRFILSYQVYNKLTHLKSVE